MNNFEVTKRRIALSPMMINDETVFISGASQGFGPIWAEAALKRSDNVIATARNISVPGEPAAKSGDRDLRLQPCRRKYPDPVSELHSLRRAGIKQMGTDHHQCGP